MDPYPVTPPPRSPQRGLTLIELLVAIILTGIIAWITIEMITGEKINYTRTRDKVNLQSDAREALRIMEEELKNAGYRLAPQITAGNLLTTQCAEGLYSVPPPSGGTESGTALSAFPRDTSSLRFRFYNPNPNAPSAFNCRSDLIEIGYSWDPGTQLLSRTLATGAAAAGPPVPFLAGVLGFSVEYGTYAQEAEMLQTRNQLTTGDLEAQSGAVLLGTQLDNPARPWLVQDWPVGSMGRVRLRRGADLDREHTYPRFQARATAGFLDPVTGLDSCRMVFQHEDGTRLVVPFRPDLALAGRFIEYEFAPPRSGTWFLSLEASKRSVTDTDPDRVMAVQSVELLRLNTGSWDGWFRKDAPGDWNAVRFVRLRLVARSNGNTQRPDTLRLERIIPVVNHGL